MNELRGLQCFVTLAEELNFSRAAERLHRYARWRTAWARN